MHTFKRISLSLLLATTASFAAACGDDKGDSDASTGGGPTAPATDTVDPTTTTDTPTTGTPTTVEPTTVEPTTVDPTTVDPTTEDPTTGEPGDPFVFDETPPGDMDPLDRMGMPAIATAVISSEFKDIYNASTPEDDAKGNFVDDIVKNVTGLHAALDDDLMGAGLVPCAAMACVGQAAPLVVPDVLHIDTGMAAGFPNGRALPDPVIDVTLAVVLLDLTAKGQTAATLAGLPLNPPKNDVEFLKEFPYLAAPH